MDRPGRSLLARFKGSSSIWWNGAAGVVAVDAFFGDGSSPATVFSEINTITATGAGSEVAPDGTTHVRIETWGGGGGGRYSGWGGGGGGYAHTLIAASVGNTVYYNVGTGGAGALSGVGNGVDGGDSWGNLGTNSAPASSAVGAVARGGRGGDTTASPGGTGGGVVSANIGAFAFSGGSSNHSATVEGGGGGAGSGGAGQTGGAGAVGTGGAGGTPDGGAGGTGVNPGDGAPGSQPGGGGGASPGANNGGAGGAGQVRITFYYVAPSAATWDPITLGNGITLSNGNLTGESIGAEDLSSARSTRSMTAGKDYYFEVEATAVANGNFVIGVVNNTKDLDDWVASGASSDGIGVNPSGSVYWNGSNQGASVDAWDDGDIICVYYKRSNETIRFRTNGGAWSSFYDVSSFFTGDTVFAAANGGVTGNIYTGAFARASWTFTPPDGALSIDETSTTRVLKWNSADKGSEVALSNGDLTVERAGSYTVAYNSVRGNTALVGKTYYEVKIDSGFGGSGDYELAVGFANVSFAIEGGGAYLGGDANGVGGWSGSADEVYYSGGSPGAWSPTSALSPGDIIGVLYDPTADLFWVRKNAGNWNDNGSADPAAGTGGYSAAISGTTYAALCIKNGGSGVATVRFDEADWTYAAPSGFLELGAVASTRLNPADTINSPTISNGDLRITARVAGDRQRVRSVNGTALPFYFEVNQSNAGDSPALYNGHVLLFSPSATLANGTVDTDNIDNALSIGFPGYFDNGTNSSIPSDWTSYPGVDYNGRLCIAVNPVTLKLWVRNNNGAWNPNYVGAQNPATGDGGVDLSTVPGFSTSGASLKVGADTQWGRILDFKFDDSSWRYPAPSGFVQIPAINGGGPPPLPPIPLQLLAMLVR